MPSISRRAGTPPDLNNKGDAVHRGEVFTYTWTVPERAGPGPMDPSSILWMYHSHFNESRDMNSGLLGPIIISRKGSNEARWHAQRRGPRICSGFR